MSNDSTNLCTGFLTTRIDYVENTILHTNYAVLPDGTVLESNEHIQDNSFDTPARSWKRVEARPAEAEFIGNYPIPAVRAMNAFQRDEAAPVRSYSFNAHTISIARGGAVVCPSCSVPLVIADAIRFMHRNNVRNLVVDGVEIAQLGGV